MKSDHPDNATLADRPDRFRTLLLSWFDDHRRPLPWRSRRTLYGTWISEMMLQQTTVATVGPYWERFLAAFPDVQSLAAADLEEVLSLWSGLGYYRRARHLHQAAREVVDRGGGVLPRDREGWLRLPGVGPYASGAIASIGLDERVPALDANARRVLTRWLIDDPRHLDDLWPAHLDRIGAELVDPDRPGDWNEAVMELGALVCRAAAPRCGDCPVANLCRASQAGIEDRIPPPKTAVVTQPVRLGVLVLLWGDRVFLRPPGSGPAVVPPGSTAPVRQDVRGLHRGLWGLPSTPWLPGRPASQGPWPGKIWRPWLETVPGLESLARGEGPDLLGGFRHSVTRYRLTVKVYGWGLDGERFSLRNGDPAPEPPISSSEGSLPEGRDGDTPPAGYFCHRQPLEHPVSNLVNKSLTLAMKTIV